MKVSEPLKLGEDAVEELLEQNLMTSLRLSQMTAKRMILQAEKSPDGAGAIGTIVNLSSIAATRTQSCLLGYSIACAAVDQMTRSLAVALAPKGIRVNAMAIGSVLSASLQNALKDQPDFRAVIEQGTPLGRVADASQLVETVQYLASDASSFVTGQILTVDGGRSLIDVVAAPAH
jgi:7-alpha-hydroxysteroid dehydrogenase